MGEIVDLERYRKLRRRREAEANKVKRGSAPDSGPDGGPNGGPNGGPGGAEAEDTIAPPAAERAGPGPGPGHSGPNGAAKTRGDDPKTD